MSAPSLSQKILAGNWKMYKTRAETKDFFAKLEGFKTADGLRAIVAASPTLLQAAVEEAKAHKTSIEIFSQNVAYKNEGAFTGEISPKQLADLGVKGSLVGHSERRQFFGETDLTAAARARAGLDVGLDIIFCIGESLEERRHGRFESTMEQQLNPLLKDLNTIGKAAAEAKVIIAYEPVWAIGTGVVANEKEIGEAHAFIGEFCQKRGFHLNILYGGSVKPDNFAKIAAIPRVAGGLVGGASLDAASYKQLYECLTR